MFVDPDHPIPVGQSEVVGLDLMHAELAIYMPTWK
jgi:hypothetical protein